jgi:hypothetical protein
LSIPGNRKEAGETLLVALKPPQPATIRRRAGSMLNRRTFQFNLTETEYSLRYALGNL